MTKKTTRRKPTRTKRTYRVRQFCAPVKRRKTRRKMMGADFFNPAQAQEGVKVIFEGAAGGIGAHFLNKILPATLSPQTKGLITLGAGFVTAVVARRPILGAGMAALGMVNLLKDVNFLADETAEFTTGMESLPLVLNEGEAFELAENFDLSDNFELAEEFESDGSNYEVGYYPEFGGI